MSGQNTTFTRRSVAKGAAWAVPAVVIAQAAPAMAASDACYAVLRESSGGSVGVLGLVTTSDVGTSDYPRTLQS